jgi:hypothetical protein
VTAKVLCKPPPRVRSSDRPITRTPPIQSINNHTGHTGTRTKRVRIALLATEDLMHFFFIQPMWTPPYTYTASCWSKLDPLCGKLNTRDTIVLVVRKP